MPRFFFTLHDHFYESDEVGVELPDRTAARIESIRFAGEVMRDQPHLLDSSQMVKVCVTDANGAAAFRLEIRAIDAPD